MRSGTSFFNGTVFKKTILRFWPVWAAYCAVWFVAMPLNALMLLQMDARDPSWGGSYLHNFAKSTVTGLCDLSLGMAVFFGVLAAMAVCSHLYNAKSANFFGSLPVRREGMFLTHYLAGLSFLIVPNAVVFLLTLAIEGAGGAMYLPELLFWLGVTCGECLFFYSMAVCVGMFTGHILALPAFYLIFNGLAYVLYQLLNWVFNSFYYGYASFENGGAGVVAWLTPMLKLGRGVNAYPKPSGLDVVAVYAVAGAALTAGSFFLYRARRLESAGDVVSVKCMRPVFKYSVAVCSGLFFGMLTAQMVNMHEPGMMVSMLVWAIIGYFAAQMLLDKTFRVFKKWKGAAAVAAAFVLMYLVVGFDLTGFETRVPAADQVDFVQTYGLTLCHLDDAADYVDIRETDPEFIKLAILLHQTAVEQRDMNRPSGAAGTSLGVEGTSLNLTYYLKDGSTLTRSYTLWVDTKQVDQEGSAAWAIQQIYSNRDLYWRIYGFEEAERLVAEEGYRMEEAYYENDKHAEDVDPVLYYYGRDAQALYEAVKEDFQAGRIGVRTVGGENNWGRVRHSVSFSFVKNVNHSQVRISVNIYVQDTASSTLAVLERLAKEGTGEYQPSNPSDSAAELSG